MILHRVRVVQMKNSKLLKDRRNKHKKSIPIGDNAVAYDKEYAVAWTMS